MPETTYANPVEREAGPRGWYLPTIESAYTRLVPRDQAVGAVEAPRPGAFSSRLQPGRGEDVLADLDQNFWLDRLGDYKRRKTARAAARLAAAPTAPAIPGGVNWSPLGPAVVLHGQAHGLPAVGGRVAGISISQNGQTVYVATANGGVFRSDDTGISWRALMDAFDVDPTNFASTSLACGAIAIDPTDPRRVYVGTGEGDTATLFAQRIVNALPAYRGIGPIRSDDGGDSWVSEPTAAGSSPLTGKAFYGLAVDPADRERVVAATTDGLYQRTVTTTGVAEWVQRRPGMHSSVAVTAAGGHTRFYAAEWGMGVVHSTDGATWAAAGTGFPSTGVGRIALGVQRTNPDLVYALVSNTHGALLGVYRLDGVDQSWQTVDDPPDVLPTDNGSSQGDYDLAIAVDPADAGLIYLGGSYYADGQFWPASIWRCRVTGAGASLGMSSTPIGAEAHADVHVLLHAPGDPNTLWVGCDGGVFLNRDPRGSGTFGSRNNGLSSLCSNFIAQHPTDPNVLFCGLQDNGTARTAGGPIWTHVNWGDGGYCVVNWASPNEVLVFANGTVYRATDGGQGHDSWTPKKFPWALMTEPIVTTPYNPARPADGRLVALGSLKNVGSTFQRVVFISTDFGATWPTEVAIPSTAGIFALSFASATRLYAGTTAGEVFRLDRTTASWTVSRLDNAPAGPLGLRGLVADIAVDWSDASAQSIYITFGGVGDSRHVWRYDGTRWEARSGLPGPGADNLLDVEHNAIVVDQAAPTNVYVGADIGVWHSADSGRTWHPLENGLPDAPVFDLQIHPTRRLLRAATHGRGIYEYPL